jgi:hypothetical protein
LSACGPVITNKNLFVQQWMLDEKGGLGDEIRRFESARHDDVIDALHMIIAYLASGIRPEPTQPANCYIAADLAFKKDKNADYTIFMAVAIDWRGRHFIIDYKRFQEDDPTKTAQQLIQFFQTINAKASRSGYNNQKKNRLANSYR